jgi:hypothetical protein
VKQFCTSTTISAASAPGLILVCADALETSEVMAKPPAAVRNERRDAWGMGSAPCDKISVQAGA